jgi:hypothetical protein
VDDAKIATYMTALEKGVVIEDDEVYNELID